MVIVPVTPEPGHWKQLVARKTIAIEILSVGPGASGPRVEDTVSQTHKFNINRSIHKYVNKTYRSVGCLMMIFAFLNYDDVCEGGHGDGDNSNQ